MRMLRFLTGLWAGLFFAVSVAAEPMDRDILEGLILPPFSLGEPINDDGVYALLNSGGIEAGYVFETEPLAPLPGFSGAPINALVVLDLEGKFLDVRLINQNEPIFVSGLSVAPFHKFFEQYPGLSISSSIVVGTPYGDGGSGSSLIYLDGVTKATASVRIAHDSVMAAALAVAREKMQGLSASPPAHPNPDHVENLDWQDLLAQRLVTHQVVSNAEVDAAFAGTLWEDEVLPQAGKAAWAASRAASISSEFDRAISQITSPVIGVVFSKYAPDLGSTNSPLMKFA